ESVGHALRDAAQALPGAKRVAPARNLEGCWGAGDYTLDVLRDERSVDSAAAFAALAQLPGIARVDGAACRPIGGGLREPGLRDGVWRTLMLRVRPQASEAQVASLEHELLHMPAFIPGIRNWRLNRIETPGAW
ncbi:antibiotic biosynthesis monooxygenase family protein, partial [Pantoea agglomerans]|uniref:hypothetical protein n=1 Tax=Enterobacter agglomerans TaxID=549 RepID=UPI001CA3C07E